MGIPQMEVDPQDALHTLLRYGVGQVTDAVFANTVMRALFEHYLNNGDESGGAFLERFGVVDGISGVTFYSLTLGGVGFDYDELQFTDMRGSNSTLLTSNGDVRITVRYEIYYVFGGMPLPFSPTLRMSQVVQTRAWLGGSGVGYEHQH